MSSIYESKESALFSCYYGCCDEVKPTITIMLSDIFQPREIQESEARRSGARLLGGT